VNERDGTIIDREGIIMDREGSIRGLNDEIDRLNNLIEQGGLQSSELNGQLSDMQRRLQEAEQQI